MPALMKVIKAKAAAEDAGGVGKADAADDDPRAHPHGGFTSAAAQRRTRRGRRSA
jgi:hypothetical protein